MSGLLDRWRDGEAEAAEELNSRLAADSAFARDHARQARLDGLVREVLRERAARPCRRQPPRARAAWRPWLVAAGLLLAGTLGLELWRDSARAALMPWHDGQAQTTGAWTADMGGELRWRDGSRLSLAAGTRLRWQVPAWPWGADIEVELIAGRVDAKIASQPAGRSFCVQAGAARARVLGTAFSLARQAGRRRLVVGSGRVAFSAGGSERICPADSWCEAVDGALSQLRAGAPAADGPPSGFRWPDAGLRLQAGRRQGDLLLGDNRYPTNHEIYLDRDGGLALLSPGCRLHLRWRILGAEQAPVTCWFGSSRPSSGGVALAPGPAGVWQESVVDPFALTQTGDAVERVPLPLDRLLVLVISTAPQPGVQLEVSALELSPAP